MAGNGFEEVEDILPPSDEIRPRAGRLPAILLISAPPKSATEEKLSLARSGNFVKTGNKFCSSWCTITTAAATTRMSQFGAEGAEGRTQETRVAASVILIQANRQRPEAHMEA